MGYIAVICPGATSSGPVRREDVEAALQVRHPGGAGAGEVAAVQRLHGQQEDPQAGGDSPPVRGGPLPPGCCHSLRDLPTATQGLSEVHRHRLSVSRRNGVGGGGVEVGE